LNNSQESHSIIGRRLFLTAGGLTILAGCAAGGALTQPDVSRRTQQIGPPGWTPQPRPSPAPNVPLYGNQGQVSGSAYGLHTWDQNSTGWSTFARNPDGTVCGQHSGTVTNNGGNFLVSGNYDMADGAGPRYCSYITAPLTTVGQTSTVSFSQGGVLQKQVVDSATVQGTFTDSAGNVTNLQVFSTDGINFSASTSGYVSVQSKVRHSTPATFAQCQRILVRAGLFLDAFTVFFSWVALGAPILAPVVVATGSVGFALSFQGVRDAACQ